MKRQDTQHAAILIPGRNVELVKVPTLQELPISEETREAFKEACFETAGCFKSPEEADLEVRVLEESLLVGGSVRDGDGAKPLPVRPDAFFTLEDSRQPAGANLAHFFLEADRSTENQARFRDKIRAYWHYIENGRHGEKFGIKNVRVLTVAKTDERAKNLALLANSLLPERAWKYYRFSSLKSFSIENPAPILEAVHLSPRDVGRRLPLVPGYAARKVDQSAAQKVSHLEGGSFYADLLRRPDN